MELSFIFSDDGSAEAEDIVSVPALPAETEDVLSVLSAEAEAFAGNSCTADESVDAAPVSAADDEVAAARAPHPEKVPVPIRTAVRTRAAAEAAFFIIFTPFLPGGVS